MRVVIDARAVGPHFPGIGRATRGLLFGLYAIQHDADIVVLYDPHHRDLLDAVGLPDDPRFILHPWADAPLGMAQQWNGPRLARRFAPDVWHAPYYFRPFVGLPPTVITVFDTIGLAATDRAALSPRQLVWNGAMRASIGTARRIVTASEAAHRDIMAQYGVAADRITVVPLATEPHFAPPSAERIAQVRATFALPERYVLYLGSNKPHKNLVALVDAWALLRDGAPDGTLPLLVIAGREDPRYGAARQRVVERNVVQHVRFVPDVPDADAPALLGGALLFVFPSLHEGFGLPPLEAMAAGTPVVSSNHTSLPEVVGNAGLLVDPEPDALAMAVRALLADDARRADFRERGLVRAADFSWQRTAQMMLDVYGGVGNRG